MWISGRNNYRIYREKVNRPSVCNATASCSERNGGSRIRSDALNDKDSHALAHMNHETKLVKRASPFRRDEISPSESKRRANAHSRAKSNT